jgi:hypothetical protein
VSKGLGAVLVRGRKISRHPNLPVLLGSPNQITVQSYWPAILSCQLDTVDTTLPSVTASLHKLHLSLILLNKACIIPRNRRWAGLDSHCYRMCQLPTAWLCLSHSLQNYRRVWCALLPPAPQRSRSKAIIRRSRILHSSLPTQTRTSYRNSRTKQ